MVQTEYTITRRLEILTICKSHWFEIECTTIAFNLIFRKEKINENVVFVLRHILLGHNSKESKSSIDSISIAKWLLTGASRSSSSIVLINLFVIYPTNFRILTSSGKAQVHSWFHWLLLRLQSPIGNFELLQSKREMYNCTIDKARNKSIANGYHNTITTKTTIIYKYKCIAPGTEEWYKNCQDSKRAKHHRPANKPLVTKSTMCLPNGWSARAHMKKRINAKEWRLLGLNHCNEFIVDISR